MKSIGKVIVPLAFAASALMVAGCSNETNQKQDDASVIHSEASGPQKTAESMESQSFKSAMGYVLETARKYLPNADTSNFVQSVAKLGSMRTENDKKIQKLQSKIAVLQSKENSSDIEAESQRILEQAKVLKECIYLVENSASQTESATISTTTGTGSNKAFGAGVGGLIPMPVAFPVLGFATSSENGTSNTSSKTTGKQTQYVATEYVWKQVVALQKKYIENKLRAADAKGNTDKIERMEEQITTLQTKIEDINFIEAVMRSAFNGFAFERIQYPRVRVQNFYGVLGYLEVPNITGVKLALIEDNLNGDTKSIIGFNVADWEQIKNKNEGGIKLYRMSYKHDRAPKSFFTDYLWVERQPGDAFVAFTCPSIPLGVQPINETARLFLEKYNSLNGIQEKKLKQAEPAADNFKEFKRPSFTQVLDTRKLSGAAPQNLKSSYMARRRI